MYAGHTIGVVIPAYNEERFIGDVIQAIPGYVDRIFVVDDASTDETWNEIAAATTVASGRSVPQDARTDGGASVAADQQLEQVDTTELDRGVPAGRQEPGDSGGLKQEWNVESMADSGDSVSTTLVERTTEIVLHGRVVAIRHQKNEGAGGAVKTGYLAALVDTVDVVATIDGDGQMNPRELADLIDPIVEGNAGYVKGNRLLNREYRRDMPTFRLVGNSILTFLTKIASGYWRVVDPQNGYTAISREALQAIDIENLYEDYGYVNDLLIKLNVVGTHIADVPTAVHYSDEESNIQFPSYLTKLSQLLLTGFLWRLKVKYLVLDFHPLVFFYLFGAAFTGVGIFGGGYTLWRLLATDASGLFGGLLSTFLFVSGMLFLLLAMVFDREANRSLVRPQQFN